MKTKQIIPILALLLLVTLGFPSCSEKTEYADDIPCAELMDSVEKQIPVNFGYETYGGDQIQFYFENTEVHDDACLRYSMLSEDINEIGIFHTPDEDARKEILRLTQSYLEQMKADQSAFIASYAPQELPKLENAEIKTFGNYTVYAILDDEDRKLVFETVEKKLSEKN